ncbi:serpentine type 7TM GPCR chemoreceptor srd domain-containing protein [Ditylenchus destructor]|uniref:Serpentine type 7TM GPCR chemoreceptor srd domain-containing protein n=1 Tax=Ditylenchus destructor TaxID=166010 RepID=A0AAD4QS83_9BILA|nr:serpentine type 7TM GPCR chemoreceptor srd domain-containing protein [Ditylenchus destructor]
METTVNGLSIIFNCYLLYLIQYYSTFGVKVYKYLLTADALLDLALAVVVFIAQPVGLTGDGYTVMISNGFFAGWSPVVDSLLITLFAFILHTNVLWIPVQFVYRYRLLCKENENSRQANILIVTVATLYSLIAWFVVSAMCQVREEFQAKGEYVLDLNDWPKHDERRITYYVGSYVKDWRMITWLFLWIITCSASIFIVIWCEKRIIKSFKQFGRPTQASTQKMHKDFHRALLAMAICPLITTCIPLFYFCVTIGFSLCPGKISSIMSLGTTCITLFNPLTTILFLRCYRRAAVRLITCGLRSNVVDPGETAIQKNIISGQNHSPQAYAISNNNPMI